MSTDELPTFRERFFASAIKPAMLMQATIYYALVTFVEAPFLLLTNFSVFKRKALAKFWSAHGKEMSQDFSGRELIRNVSGTVLDLGPGAGYLLHLIDPEKVNAVYGVEPAIELIPEIAVQAEHAGLGGIYQALAAGAEPESLLPALDKAGLLKNGSEGVFDTILCMRVLCGVRQKDTVPTLYQLLKPGGRLILSEHVRSPWPKQGEFMGFISQKIYTLLGWKFWVGCSLNNDTLSALKEAGGPNGWASFDIQYANAWHTIPHIVGTLVKS